MMLKDLLSRQRAALIGLAAFIVAIGAYAIVKGQKQPAPIVFQGFQPTPVTTGKAPAEAPSEVVVVDATGAVKRPAVVRLPSGSRVEDAVKAAGGSTNDADLEQINLAAKLVDGTQVFVPRKGKSAEGAVADGYKGGSVIDSYSAHSPSSRNSGDGSRAKKEPPSHPISLNSASNEELQSIPGIGPATALKILDYRHQHGGFKSVDELATVKGIGEKRLNAMKKYLKL